MSSSDSNTVLSVDKQQAQLYLAMALLLSGRGDQVDWASVSTEDWVFLQVLAQKEGIAALLYSFLDHSNLPIPPVVRSQLAPYYYQNAARNTVLYTVLEEVLKVLAHAGVPVILLKGAALAKIIYEDISLRPMVDLDLLIGSEGVERALASLSSAGYLRAGKTELRQGFDRQFRVEVELLSPTPNACVVEVHWRLLGPLFTCQHVHHASIWERSVPVTILGQPANTLGAEDWVLHQAAHAVYKHRRISLLNLCDLDRLIRYLDKRLDWEVLLKIGCDFHWLPALSSIFPLCRKYFATPIPDQVINAAAAYQLPRTDRWLYDWWLAPGRPEQYHIIPDWLALPGIKAKVRMLWAYLFPDRAYMEALYRKKTGLRLPLYYVRRFFAGIDKSL